MRRVPIALAFALCAIAEMVVPTLGTSQERRAVVGRDLKDFRQPVGDLFGWAARLSLQLAQGDR